MTEAQRERVEEELTHSLNPDQLILEGLSAEAIRRAEQPTEEIPVEEIRALARIASR